MNDATRDLVLRQVDQPRAAATVTSGFATDALSWLRDADRVRFDVIGPVDAHGWAEPPDAQVVQAEAVAQGREDAGGLGAAGYRNNSLMRSRAGYVARHR